MRALTILSYDSDLSKNDQKTIWLIEMHRMLIQQLKHRLSVQEANSVGVKGAVALYFEI
jgi:hypothetical protein